MDVDKVIKQTYHQVLGSKLRYGFIHGVNDCFAFGIHYHYNLFKDETILEVLKKPYNSERQLIKIVQSLGYKNIPDVFVRRGYTLVSTPEKGDIAIALLPLASSQSLIINEDKNSWITSANDINNDRIRITSTRLSMIGRPPYELLL
jgi:hypothetical protein